MGDDGIEHAAAGFTPAFVLSPCVDDSCDLQAAGFQYRPALLGRNRKRTCRMAVLCRCLFLVSRPFSCLSMYRASAVVCQRKATAAELLVVRQSVRSPKEQRGPGVVTHAAPSKPSRRRLRNPTTRDLDVGS